jgi:hypothetical protein
MFPCFTCGRVAFTIRGCCDQCDLGAHRAFSVQVARNAAIEAAYLRDTGLHPFANWQAFEHWCRQQGVGLV